MLLRNGTARSGVQRLQPAAHYRSAGRGSETGSGQTERLADGDQDLVVGGTPLGVELEVAPHLELPARTAQEQRGHVARAVPGWVTHVTGGIEQAVVEDACLVEPLQQTSNFRVSVAVLERELPPGLGSSRVLVAPRMIAMSHTAVNVSGQFRKQVRARQIRQEQRGKACQV